jgi:hypothetical protein
LKKRVYLAALLAASSLAACGGGKAQFSVTGTVSNLAYDGLQLATNGQTLTVPKGATTFSFPQTISYGDTYNVTIASQPAHENCVVGGGNDSAGRLASIAVTVTCGIIGHAVSGSVTGLTGAGLVLTNGSNGTVTVAATATTYTFGSAAVAYGSTYGITVLTQPAGQTCSVANPIGLMGDNDVTNVNVTCVNNP